jgi:protein-L-isoaspartate(D-aspartate) O-methyltransferase
MQSPSDFDHDAARQSMVELIEIYVQLSSDQIDRERLDPRVIAAMAQVPRHAFVPVELQYAAYADSPIPIGCGKTVSQPFMVALMTDLLGIEEGDRVLEVGTGLGYHAAVLAELADRVFTVEIHAELAREGEDRLGALDYRNIHFKVGDGAQGWPKHAPFDRIMVAAAPELLPPVLLQQLKPGGRMVVPTGLPDQQQLLVVDKGPDGRIETREIVHVVFSPLIASH